MNMDPRTKPRRCKRPDYNSPPTPPQPHPRRPLTSRRNHVPRRDRQAPQRRPQQPRQRALVRGAHHSHPASRTTMWSSSLAAVALAAALEASPAQNTARGHDYVLGNKFVEPITTVSGTAQTVRAQTPLHSWPRSLRSSRAEPDPPVTAGLHHVPPLPARQGGRGCRHHLHHLRRRRHADGHPRRLSG